MFKSLVKTKHQIVLVVPRDYQQQYLSPNKHQKTTLYDIRSHNIDILRHLLGTFDWSIVRRDCI